MSEQRLLEQQKKSVPEFLKKTIGTVVTRAPGGHAALRDPTQEQIQNGRRGRFRRLQGYLHQRSSHSAQRSVCMYKGCVFSVSVCVCPRDMMKAIGISIVIPL